MPDAREEPDGRPLTLAEVGEDELLARIFPRLRGGHGDGGRVLVGPGDDTAVLAVREAALVTTDALVRGQDWLDEWSTGVDVGAKAVAQNLADVAAMGGAPTGVLVTLLADPATLVTWVEDLADGLALGCAGPGVPVLGGDLSAAGPGALAVCVTALGELGGRAPVLRSGARPGDVVAVGGTLGRSAAGWLLLREGRSSAAPDLVAYHLRPRPPYELGPAASGAGASALIDLSDGLGRDAGRVARASGVRITLDDALLQPYAAALADAAGPQAWDCVLSGGEEHSLLACFPPGTSLPAGYQAVGSVDDGAGVQFRGAPLRGGGWDHFGG